MALRPGCLGLGASWMSLLLVDDWVVIEAVRSETSMLGLCPNNILLYEVTRRLLVEEKRAYISYGLSSLQVQANGLSMHKYKTRMGYEAIPMHRHFVVRPIAWPSMATRVGSWGLELASRMMPAKENLRKIAGVSRILSGRLAEPLRWVEEDVGALTQEGVADEEV